MKRYRSPLVMREAIAEIPALPGCQAWGGTAAEALENLPSAATAFMESYGARGDSLPPEVEAAPVELAGPGILSEVLVAV